MKKGFHLLLYLTMLSAAGCFQKKNVKQGEKVLNIAVSAKVKGMDPIRANDRYSSNEVARVYEGLLEYHYLKRPYELVPNLAEDLPKVSSDGLTYTFKIKKGVKFQDDKAFTNGKGRELKAKDFVYSIKRTADPKNQGLGWWVLDGKVKGLNEWRKKYSELPKTNYDEEVEGLRALDDYTLEFKLVRPFPQFLYALAMSFYFVVPREVVEHYGKEFLNHPVGTGPFAIERFSPNNNRLVYVKNPTFRKKLFPKEASAEFVAKGLLADAGKPLPLVDKIIVQIMTESQPRWLNFQKGKLDVMGIPKDNFDTVMTPAKDLSDDMKSKGIQLTVTPSLDLTYTAFNHSFKLFENVDLRRALSLAYNHEKANELFYNGTAMKAESIVPPGIAGYKKTYKNPFREYNIQKAKEYLAKAGYPEGKGLPEVTLDTVASTVSRQMGEFFRKSMSDIGVKVKVISNAWPELQKKISTKATQLHGIAWGADYPDAENFLQLLYGPNEAPGSNGSNYNNDEFNKIFEKARVMQSGQERSQLYEKLNKMAAEQVPLIYGFHRNSYVLNHSWLRNYIVSDLDAGQAQYLNVDIEKKNVALKKF